MSFVPGHRLSQALYDDVVAPAVTHTFPGLRWGAGMFGPGSDVMGYDTQRSADHDWGPRLTIVVPPAEVEHLRGPILDAVETELPDTIHGVPVDHRGSSQLPGGEVTHHHTAGRARPHGVTVTTLPDLLESVLGLRSADDLDAAVWLSLPQQSLLEVASGPVWRDDTGEVTRARDHLAFYPHDIWLYLMAARWQRIGQVEPFVGRTGELGDDLGSHLVTASIARDVVHLSLLQQRRYSPYAKWLGTAFAATPAATALTPYLDQACRATTWPERESAVLAALVELGRSHDALGETRLVQGRPVPFFDRPYRVLFAERYSDALRAAIIDPVVAALAPDLGGIDTLTDSTLALADRSLREHLAQWWRSGC